MQRRVAGRRRAATRSPRTPRSRRGRRARRTRRAGRWSALGVAVVVAIALPWAPGRSASPPPSPDQIHIIPEATTATATWTGSSSSSFRVEYANRLDFADATKVRVRGHRVVLRSLTPGTQYFLRVVSLTDGAPGRPSKRVQFVTALPETAPALRVASTTSTSLTARWKHAKGKRYEAQLATDPTFAEPRTKLSDTDAATFGKLDRATEYSLRVRVVDSAGTPQSPWSNVITRKPAPSHPLRVGSFNVLKSPRAAWSKRRIAIAKTIVSQRADVVGLQEATPIHVAGGLRQYADVVRALGSSWSLTDAGSGPTGEARTVYNRSRVKLVDHGYRAVRGSSRFGTVRYVTWAIFEQKSTGKRFVFVNTHFVYQKSRSAYAQRTAAARQLVDLVRAVNPQKLPVVIVGDFNSGAYRTSANGVYRTITQAGYVHPLDKPHGRLGSAEKRIGESLKTVNGYRRTAPRDAWAPMVDAIFVSPMRVAEWQTVASLDARGRFIGTIPSDHNMIRVTVYLP